MRQPRYSVVSCRVVSAPPPRRPAQGRMLAGLKLTPRRVGVSWGRSCADGGGVGLKCWPVCAAKASWKMGQEITHSKSQRTDGLLVGRRRKSPEQSHGPWRIDAAIGKVCDTANGSIPTSPIALHLPSLAAANPAYRVCFRPDVGRGERSPAAGLEGYFRVSYSSPSSSSFAILIRSCLLTRPSIAAFQITLFSQNAQQGRYPHRQGSQASSRHLLPGHCCQWHGLLLRRCRHGR